MGVEYDKITVTHTLQFCKPVPKDDWDTGEYAARTDCGIYKRDLKDYPYNDTPSGGTSKRISPSEMVMCYLKLENYPGSGGVDMLWSRKSDVKPFAIGHWDVAANSVPTRTSWWIQMYGGVGHFPGEIVTEELHYVYISTTWGDAKIWFDVVDTSEATILEKVRKQLINPVLDKIGDINKALGNVDQKIMEALSAVQQEAQARAKALVDLEARIKAWITESIFELLMKKLDEGAKDARSK